MNKTSIGACLVAPLLAAPLAIGAASFPALAAEASHTGYLLTSEALVMIPAMNQDWLDLTKSLYLVPNGFDKDSDPTFLQVPETSNLNQSMAGVQDILIKAIETKWDAGEFSAEDPLYVFGYSQAAVAAGMSEQALHDYGIPSDALHFVFVGDSATPDGFLANIMATLLQWVPESWRPEVTDWINQFAEMNHINTAIGVVTPDNLFTTDTYTLTGDGFANWDNGANAPGMFWDHLAYLGLTPDEIAGATIDPSDLTTYHIIDSADVNMFDALSNSFNMIMGGMLAWF
ncbi:PE-PPE domain-containing protein [Mycobacterium sp. M1]|uniref:PE-PPE domain-containing protein n=1 Tax=Mycolicibacter acidiphilus TaxID=2835306 RepID=A0ABS5RJM4_9MYCO|nr:PE-PPE domain-containing protein [Mycolicibacter acidiphilus]MBS9533783.1 PE-PPE domain-containing protein [Mycolicibacter acidiphilus]